MKGSRNVVVLLIVTIIAIGAIFVMLFSPIIINNHSDSFGYAINLYQNFSPTINSFSSPNLINLSSTDNIKPISFSITDDAVYMTAWISINGTAWQPITLTGTALSGNWLQQTSTGTYNIPRTNIPNGTGTDNYIITYSCTKNTTTNPITWNCHGNKWQIKTFNTTKIENTGIINQTIWTDELMINGDFESGNLNGWITSGPYWSVGADVINGVAGTQSGSYCAFATGTSDPAGYIYQDVDVSPYSVDIDSGKAIVNASGWGVSSEYSGQDLSRIQIFFLNSTRGVITTVADSGVMDSAPWWQKGISNYPITKNTRYIRMWGNTYEVNHSSGNLDSFSVKVRYGGTVVQPPACTPSCSGKQCGSDGCTGSCGSCSNSHGTTSCSAAGICQPLCSSGYATCDSNNVNGCETQLGTMTNCASCGDVCLTGQSCINSICTTSSTPPVSTTGNTYYVATPADGGSDSNSGTTADKPFATWKKGFEMAQAGDTVYIKGGTYVTTGYYASGNYNGVFVGGKSGTASEPINVFAYNGDAILDCSGMIGNGVHLGIAFENSNYWHLKGLTIRNVPATLSGAWSAVGFSFYESDNNIIENCVSHDNEGPGFAISGDNDLFLNCDAYNNYDDKAGGENADGFIIGNVDYRYTVTFRGCRSWHNSDDGYDTFGYEGTAIYENCWSFDNGAYNSTQGDGAGFKLGITSFEPLTTPQRVYNNCIAADNRLSGYDESQDSGSLPHINQIYNSISYNNAEGYSFGYSGSPTDTIRNSISYKDYHVGSFASDTVDHNSWQTGFTVSDSDFVSVNSSQLLLQRKSDGSLPNITFLHLTSNSKLIDAGVDVGLPYLGNAPDIGAYENR